MPFRKTVFEKVPAPFTGRLQGRFPIGVEIGVDGEASVEQSTAEKPTDVPTSAPAVVKLPSGWNVVGNWVSSFVEILFGRFVFR
jgi:hypothetical protein